MSQHQSISNIRVEHSDPHEGPISTTTVYEVSKMEVLSVWKCAAKLAELEGFPGVAERLRHDANVLEWANAGDRIEIR